MNEPGVGRVSVSDTAPAGWSTLLSAHPQHEFTFEESWTRAAADHYPGAAPCWISAHADGEIIGGMPVLRRRRQGLTRLESHFDGTAGGLLLHPDLGTDERARVAVQLVDALENELGGLTALAAVSADPGQTELAAALRRPGWQRHDYHTALVDCRQGEGHVETELWTNNRRNERNRGLKRGCILESGRDPATLDQWYPLYRRKSEQWAQAAVPLEFLREIMLEHPEEVCLDVIRHEGEVVGGHYCFVSGDRLVAWQGAARADLARSLFLTPLLYWRNILTACERGLDWVDFGGCVGRDSLWDFKRRCGAQPAPRVQWIRRTHLGRVLQDAADALRRFRGGLR